jgi:3'(2'), 5'-bisphosphate nucleotidase
VTVRIDWAEPRPANAPEEAAADLEAAALAAVEGGVAARPFYRDDDLGIHHKNPGDPVTEADHAANDAILGVLRARRSEDVVRSEESAAPRSVTGAHRLWVVDPLDGTKEFIARNGEFAMMVGLAVDGAARLGAVLKPDPGRLYLGLANGGAWVADVRWESEGEQGQEAESIAASVGPFTALRLPEAHPARLRMARSRSHPDPLITAVAEALDADEVLSGSVGVKCSLIAEGRADVYVHPVPFLKEWDTCAPEAVLRGAGGRVTDCAGNPLSYGKREPAQPRGIFAARADTWQSARGLVREVTSAKLGFDS